VTGRAPDLPGRHPVTHSRAMAPATTPPRPGSMTVPLLFGWELIAVVLLVLVVLAVVFFVTAASGRNVSERAELQAWLDARSSRYDEPVAPGHPSPVPDGAGRHDHTGATSA
jgi:hypothetical protein